MSENLQKLIGVVVMAVLVVVGVLFTGGDDDESVSFQRNAAILGQVPMGGDLAELEIRIQRVEKLIGQIPELAMLREVLEQAEWSLREIESATLAVGEAEERTLREIASLERSLWRATETSRERLEQRIEDNRRFLLGNAETEIAGLLSDLRGRVGLLEGELTDVETRLNTQLAGIAPQFGPEFPGLGPMVDMVCRNQLASWGVNARAVEAAWSVNWQFWACAYYWIELEGYQQPVNLAFCLPGQEFPGRVVNGFNHRLESNGRISGDFVGQENEALRFDDVCAVPVN